MPPQSARGGRMPPPSMSGRSLATTTRQGPPQQGQKRPSGPPIPPPRPSCNKCRKQMTTKAVVCACHCLLCEPCAEAHFTQHETCPVCRRKLGINDTMVLDVTNPATNETPQATKRAAFQLLFKKESVNARDLSYRGMYMRLCTQIDQVGQQSKFVMKQMMRDASIHARRNAQYGSMISNSKKQLEAKTQELNSFRQQHQEAFGNAMAKCNTHAQTIADLKQELEEKEDVLRVFRERAVSSNQSVRSADERSYESGGGHHRAQNQQVSGPMQGLINQREAEARRSQTLLQPPPSQIFPGHGNTGGGGQSTVAESYHTSFQSGHSVNSGSMGRGRPAAISMASVGIRQGTHAGSSYQYPSSQQRTNPQLPQHFTNKRRRDGHPQSTSSRAPSNNGYEGRYQQQQQQQRPRSMGGGYN